MKRVLTGLVAGAGLLALVGVAAAQMGGPGGGRWGVGHRGMGRAIDCPGVSATATEITEEKARELAQQYADKYLAGFTVERVLPFTGMRHTMYSVELKNAQGEVRTLRVTPFGGVAPFAGHAGRRA